ncbi:MULTISPECIES: FHA domain-containing protein FhaB/FipA [Actinotignum]|uniref:FHA domain-containing protein FhaB/FipA n=1 Tax=Actinotignum TaxID=1653174 RepID=UPI00254CBE2A|nr:MULTISPECIES: FHA domain-containing protein [Actinotignum]MDE1535877.1 FHA domain-containing protein [Actinotignum schaalii]MDK7271645.1 FHA domain-containing protein [Actinotignum schaalii]MDY5135597.1 FHA domain-containing protein [Actinotignum timonense]MDY5144239.1 FHA domain-containing protein [Actinotignum timonense]
MNLAITLLRFGFLALLWLFIFAVVLTVRRDVLGTDVRRRSSLLSARRRSIHAPAPAENDSPAAPAAPVERPVYLVVTGGPLLGTAVPLSSQSVYIGRAPDNTLVLDDTYASGHHARIFAAEGRRWVEDLGSTNGTLVGGIRINGSAALDPGVVIQVGETTMELQV